MATYRFRCPDHGDFEVEQPMAETTRTFPCFQKHPTKFDLCEIPSPKVLSGHLTFTQGRKEFHSGVELTGETNRETADRWKREFRAEKGYDPEPVGSRWI